MAVASSIIAAAIIGGSALASSKIQSNAANKATKAQQQGNDAALTHAKEQEALRRADYDRAYNDWLANRQQLLARYGLSAGQPVRGGSPLDAPSIGVPQGYQQRGSGPPAPGQVYQIPFPGQTRPQPRPAPQRQPLGGRPASLADVVANRQAQSARVSDWNDWRMYGIPQ